MYYMIKITMKFYVLLFLMFCNLLFVNAQSKVDSLVYNFNVNGQSDSVYLSDLDGMGASTNK